MSTPMERKMDILIDGLEDLRDGWLDGEGKAPPKEGLDWLRGWAKKIFTGRSFPFLYPTPEGCVQAEWYYEGTGVHVVLEIDLERHEGLWVSFDGMDRDVERDLNLDNGEDVAWMVGQVEEAVARAVEEYDRGSR